VFDDVHLWKMVNSPSLHCHKLANIFQKIRHLMDKGFTDMGSMIDTLDIAEIITIVCNGITIT